MGDLLAFGGVLPCVDDEDGVDVVVLQVLGCGSLKGGGQGIGGQVEGVVVARFVGQVFGDAADGVGLGFGELEVGFAAQGFEGEGADLGAVADDGDALAAADDACVDEFGGAEKLF